MKMQTKLLGSLALSALLIGGITGCGSDDDAVVAAPTVTPYTRVAVISGGWADVPAVAEKIAEYVVFNDETVTLGLPTNWVIAGANGGLDGISGPETWEPEDLLPIPGMGAEVTGTSRVIEFCNKAYALQAIGTGRFHGSALPCEVSVHSDGTNIYVDMLDAEAIFNIFFTDAADNFTPEENAAFAVMAADVKSELRQMIKGGLEDTATPAVPYTESTLEMGPEFTQSQIENDIAFRSPYIVYKYSGTGTALDGSFVKGVDDKALAEVIIDVLGTDVATADQSQGLGGLSALSAWRSGRPEPIAIPNVQVVEACSPKYAKKATALGNEYITALPCEFTVYVDETDDTNNTIAISFLNPNFMFGTMFQGAVENAYMNGDLNKTQVVEYSTLADVVFGDLRMIVDSAVQDKGAVAVHGLGLAITE
ncbi:MAG: DUF302 domain-containing protein [Campylobacterota bacterium]